MQTVVIWDSVDADIKFFVSDLDLSRYNHKYCNSAEISKDESLEINNLAYTEGGQVKVKMLTEFPIEAVLAGAKVIVTGFLL